MLISVCREEAHTTGASSNCTAPRPCTKAKHSLRNADSPAAIYFTDVHPSIEVLRWSQSKTFIKGAVMLIALQTVTVLPTPTGMEQPALLTACMPLPTLNSTAFHTHFISNTRDSLVRVGSAKMPSYLQSSCLWRSVENSQANKLSFVSSHLLQRNRNYWDILQETESWGNWCLL